MVGKYLLVSSQGFEPQDCIVVAQEDLQQQQQWPFVAFLPESQPYGFLAYGYILNCLHEFPHLGSNHGHFLSQSSLILFQLIHQCLLVIAGVARVPRRQLCCSILFKKDNDEYLVFLWEMKDDAWIRFLFCFCFYSLSCKTLGYHVIYCEERLNILALQSENKSTHKVEH